MNPSNHIVPIGEALSTMLSRTRVLWDEGRAFPGVATGFTDVDQLLGGLQPGTLTVVGSADRAALDAFINGLILHVASVSSQPALYGTSDSSPVELAVRLASAGGRVPWSSTWRGRLTAPEWTRLERAADKLAPAPLLILDSVALTVDVLEAAIGEMPGSPEEQGLMVVNRLSQIVANEEGQISRQELLRVRDVAAARSLAVVAIEATDSASLLRSDPRPKVADLPQPAVWIDHAEAILLIHDDSAVDPEHPHRGTVELNVAMNRHGPVGACRVAHLAEAGVLANLVRN